VLLGGGVLHDATTGETQLSTNSLRRVFRVVELYRDHPLPIIVSGKNPDGVSGANVCDVMAHLLERLGIPSADIVVENRSENTWENARESVVLMHQRGWNSPRIVTSASHLRRADLAFRHWKVVPELVGCDYGQDRFSLTWRLMVPSSRALSTLEEAAHELLGLLYYRWRSLGDKPVASATFAGKPGSQGEFPPAERSDVSSLTVSRTPVCQTVISGVCLLSFRG